MWREDEWFQSLDTDARLLFIYLFTNPSASVSGIYRLPLRTIEFESGIPAERVKEMLAKFSAENKAHYADGVVWVVRMRENQLPGTISPQVKTRLDKDVASIPPCSIKTAYLRHYGYPITSNEYPIGTVSIPHATDTDTDTHTDTETKQSQLPVDDSGWRAVCLAYENNIGAFTSMSSEMIHTAYEEFGEVLVVDAIKQAVKANVRKWNYVDGILARWRAEGRKAPSSNGTAKAKRKAVSIDPFTGERTEVMI